MGSFRLVLGAQELGVLNILGAVGSRNIEIPIHTRIPLSSPAIVHRHDESGRRERLTIEEISLPYRPGLPPGPPLVSENPRALPEIKAKD